MRKFMVVAVLLAALALTGVALAEVPPMICCQQGDMVVHVAAEVCPAGWALVVCPAPEATDPAWLAALKAWLDGKVFYQGDVTKILAILASFMGIVQSLKKFCEWASKWQWLLKLVPQLASVLAWLGHGWGPVIINGLVTGGTMATAAFSDGQFTGGEALAILTAIFGVTGLYKLIFDWLKILPRNAGAPAGAVAGS